VTIIVSEKKECLSRLLVAEVSRKKIITRSTTSDIFIYWILHWYR